MIVYPIAYIAGFATLLVLDFIWLGFVARGFYADRLGHLLADKPNFVAAGVFYALFIVGVVVFAVMPALRTGSLTTALGLGALFGLIAYATYDLSNFATLRDWPLQVVLVDMAWGAFVAAASAVAGFYAARGFVAA
jgi:uncharacterized membrane protein